jgi:hypothetical protein
VAVESGGCQSLNDRINVQTRRVERGKIGNRGRPEEQRKFSSPENYGVERVPLLQPPDEGNKLGARVIAEVALQELAHVALVNPGAIELIWDHDLQSAPRKCLRVERPPP